MAEFDSFRAFRRLYEKAAADGRGEVLFGANAYEKSVAALEKYALTNVGRVIFYFEFPFIGRPYLDLEVGYAHADLSAPVQFAGGRVPFFQEFFDACAEEPSWEGHDIGYTFDFARAKGNDEIVTPSLYLIPPLEVLITGSVPKFLQIAGFRERINEVLAAFAKAPKYWRPHYIGAMVGRENTPVRLGIFLEDEGRHRYSDRPEVFVEELEEYMGLEFPDFGRETLAVLSKGGFIFDLQFDLYPGGIVGDDLGVSVNFGFQNLDPKNSVGFLENGIGKDMLNRIEKMGLADARWRKMDSACYASQRIERHKDGARWVGESLTIDGIKVRFKKGLPFLSKGYLLGQSCFL